MATWFTADTHFGHRRIIELCQRPFASLEEMDRSMIESWNITVGRDDDVFHLGDFSHRSARHWSGYLRQLRGRIHLVHGNHDSDEVCTSPLWASSRQMAQVTVEGVRLVLCHYGLRTWPGARRGALCLYGHSHGNLPGWRNTLDVGVDSWGFRPVRLSEIRARLATLPEHDEEVRA